MKEGFAMAINFSCPISGEQRDNTTVRVVAGFVFVTAGSALLTAFLVSTRTAAVLAILLLCAALESFFSFCLGCRMYSLLPKKLGNVLSREFVK
jgi:hypothetical protein